MSKGSPKSTAGELKEIVESQGRKTFKKIIKQHLHHHVLFGRASRKNKNAFTIKQTPGYSVVRHDWNFKWDWLLWSDETKKLAF